MIVSKNCENETFYQLKNSAIDAVQITRWNTTLFLGSGSEGLLLHLKITE